jgi:cyclophilin family peptidyl-prolyl cis-trans isomerase
MLATASMLPTAVAEEPAGNPVVPSVVRATMRTDKPLLQAGQPVWVEFALVNQTDNRLTLRVPDISVDATDFSEMGLPIEHVFSGRNFAGPTLQDGRGERHDSKATIKMRDKVPAIKLAPHGSVGLRLDLTQYYESLSRPGTYKLVWQPYNGSISSEPLSITVLAERQAVILTDFGKIVMRFHYDKAPNHVQNFIELVEKRFYDNLTFNRIIPGGLVQGGDPLGNRRGVRVDGKRINAEFNDVPFEMGTVGMCRSNKDPDSASCQFFICLGRQPAFDGHQTAFGYIEGDESFETLRRIGAVPTEKQKGMEDYPRRPIYIRAISLENVPVREREVAKPAKPGSPATQPAASQPVPTISVERPVRSGAVTVIPSADTGTPADLPGLKAQGKVGPRKQPATSSAAAD